MIYNDNMNTITTPTQTATAAAPITKFKVYVIRNLRYAYVGFSTNEAKAKQLLLGYEGLGYLGKIVTKEVK